MSSYQWGSYNESDESFGVHRVHMVVYPPSTTRGERAWLRVWRAWPILGLICGVAAYGIAAGQVGSAMAIVVAVAIPGAIAIGLAIRVRGDPQPGRGGSHTQPAACVALLARNRGPVGRAAPHRFQ